MSETLSPEVHLMTQPLEISSFELTDVHGYLRKINFLTKPLVDIEEVKSVTLSSNTENPYFASLVLTDDVGRVRAIRVLRKPLVDIESI